ncbi:hypothetical protein LPB86_16580 [Pedobacter sp. MC2016-14]|uniref:hypothetical protein n=1 Tax=Pedobacter sp. MC2016-14 TaxID=2897327 RepID=UPI001E5708FB|nr:hypothetical protein [Pedobacter sp. MC2016-14]MCD0489862.1 hypothetical protein [Pedobacter sp. MC2016-14]
MRGNIMQDVLFEVLPCKSDHLVDPLRMFGMIGYKINGQLRIGGSDTLIIPGARGYNYHIYCAFKSADRRSQSMSKYLGVIGV